LRFEKKLLYIRCSRLLQRQRCCCKCSGRRIGSRQWEREQQNVGIKTSLYFTYICSEIGTYVLQTHVATTYVEKPHMVFMYQSHFSGKGMK
jgi:hypothetical protein